MAASQPDIEQLSVQEFVKKPNQEIPRRYLVHPEPSISSENNSIPSIPTIDLQSLLSGDTKTLELEKLHSTCQEWGIFQLVNHGVDISLMEKLKNEIEGFYELPLEERLKYKNRPGDYEGYGQTILHSADQKVDWADRFYVITNPVHRRKPNLFPRLPSSVRESLEAYISELQKVAMVLLGLMAEALKIDKKEIEEMYEDGMQALRMTYYPPCPQPDKVIGLTPHSDATGITILHQVNGAEGFEIKKDGIWMPVKFLPDSFVVNVGDMLEVTSNGLYNSILHRATVNSSKERISIAMFFNPKFEAEVGPSPILINQENPPLFKRIVMEQLVKEFFSRKLDGKSFLDKMKI